MAFLTEEIGDPTGGTVGNGGNVGNTGLVKGGSSKPGNQGNMGWFGNVEGVGANGDIVGVNEVVVLGGTCGDVGVIELGVGACANCDGGGDDKAFLGCGNSGDVCGGEVRVGGNGGKGGNLGLGTGGTTCTDLGAGEGILAVSKRWRAANATLMDENNKAMKKGNIKQ